MRCGFLSLMLLLATAPMQRVAADQWAQFRGPAGASTCESILPTEWSAESHIQWKVPVPGSGWSCPVVWDDRVYITTAVNLDQASAEATAAEEEKAETEQRRPQGGGLGGFGGSVPEGTFQWEIYCLDRASGDTLWKQVALTGKPAFPIHRTNTYASETPVVDGERIYVSFGMMGLFCYDLDGNLIWQKELGVYPMMFGWGTGSSPVLHGDVLYVQCDNQESSFLLALDKRTGEQKWRVERDEKSNWSTPYVWHNQVRTELVVGGSSKVRSYDPGTGELLWEIGPMKGRCSATPVGNDQMVYFGTGGGMGGAGPLVAVRAGAKGSMRTDDAISESSGLAWSVDRSGPPMASPLLYDGCLYILNEGGGILSCHDANTGERHYRERLPQARGFTSSPWAADGKIYCLDETGRTFVLAAGSEFKVLAENALDENCWSSPAMIDGTLYLRTARHLWSVTTD